MPADNARKVLDIYAQFEARRGHVLISNQFLAAGLRRRWDVHDLQDGIEQAHRDGWVERASEGGWRLTDAGFREMSAAHA